MKSAGSSGLQSSKRALGRRIKDLRHKKGWSQAAFAAMCGVDRSYVARIEHGQANPRCAVLQIIANALGISIFSLLERIA